MMSNGIASADNELGVVGGIVIFTLSPTLSLRLALATWPFRVTQPSAMSFLAYVRENSGHFSEINLSRRIPDLSAVNLCTLSI